MPEDDLVARLRDCAVTAREDYWHVSPELFAEAADEIERLREEKRDYAAAIEDVTTAETDRCAFHMGLTDDLEECRTGCAQKEVESD